MTYDAPGAPAGYDLGSAAFDMKAPYKAGYKLMAGSAYTVTATGTLLDAEGQPLPLLAGDAREANKENGRKVELFTNRAGSFGAQGLAPGKWIIEIGPSGQAKRPRSTSSPGWTRTLRARSPFPAPSPFGFPTSLRIRGFFPGER